MWYFFFNIITTTTTVFFFHHSLLPHHHYHTTLTTQDTLHYTYQLNINTTLVIPQSISQSVSQSVKVVYPLLRLTDWRQPSHFFFSVFWVFFIHFLYVCVIYWEDNCSRFNRLSLWRYHDPGLTERPRKQPLDWVL